MILAKKLTATAILPSRGSEEAAGLDLYADISHSLILRRFAVVKVPTGIALQIPKGYYGQIFERSSMGAKGIAIRGGVIDSDYRGEVRVMMQNLGEYPLYAIQPGDRVAQIILLPYLTAHLTEADTLDSTVRNDGAYGSTGR